MGAERPQVELGPRCSLQGKMGRQGSRSHPDPAVVGLMVQSVRQMRNEETGMRVRWWWHEGHGVGVEAVCRG